MFTLTMWLSAIALVVLFLIIVRFVCKHACERINLYHKIFNAECESCPNNDNSA